MSVGFPTPVPFPSRTRSYRSNNRSSSLSPVRTRDPSVGPNLRIPPDNVSSPTKKSALKTRLPTPSPKRRRPTVDRTDAGLNPSSPSINTLQLRNDRLGTLVRSLASSFTSSASWESFVLQYRGPSYLSSELDNVQHPAAALLCLWRDEGVPVHSSSPPWTSAQKDACIERGCHKSAKDHSSFLREELSEFIENK